MDPRSTLHYQAININKPPLKVQIGRFRPNVLGYFLIFRRDSQIERGYFLINPLFWRSIFDHFLVFLHCKTLKKLKIFSCALRAQSQFSGGEFLMFFEISEFERGEFLVRGGFLILIAR